MASAPEHDSLPRPDTVSLQASIVSPVQFVAFWTAVLTPFVLLGLVVAGVVTQYPLVSTGLVATNVAGIVLGNGYNR
jgi:hypothetical protein